LAGQNLVPKDNLMGGLVKGKSDPYVKVNVGGETFTSQVIKGNLNPTWNEMYEVKSRSSTAGETPTNLRPHFYGL